MPDLRSLPRTLIRGHPEALEKTGFRLGSGPGFAGMTKRYAAVTLWTDSNTTSTDAPSHS